MTPISPDRLRCLSSGLGVGTLSRFEHWWTIPVQFFGFANAGVPFEQIGAGTNYVLAAPLLGKPLGILSFSGASRLAGARLPEGLRVPDLLVLGITATTGFTVSLFFATASFPGGHGAGETKMGGVIELGSATGPRGFATSANTYLRNYGFASIMDGFRLPSRRAMSKVATPVGAVCMEQEAWLIFRHWLSCYLVNTSPRDQ